jgi:hypothetical protein
MGVLAAGQPGYSAIDPMVLVDFFSCRLFFMSHNRVGLRPIGG